MIVRRIKLRWSGDPIVNQQVQRMDATVSHADGEITLLQGEAVVAQGFVLDARYTSETTLEVDLMVEAKPADGMYRREMWEAELTPAEVEEKRAAEARAKLLA